MDGPLDRRSFLASAAAAIARSASFTPPFGNVPTTSEGFDGLCDEKVFGSVVKGQDILESLSACSMAKRSAMPVRGLAPK